MFATILRSFSKNLLQSSSKSTYILKNNSERFSIFNNYSNYKISTFKQISNFSTITNRIFNSYEFNLTLLHNKKDLIQTRTLTKFSFKNGTRKSVKSVVKRFFRLHWGIWIRTRAGRHKKLWKKTGSQKNRLQQHVFCNKHNSKMLDIMVTKFWRKPKYYIDDPYTFYHTRNDFSLTKKKPWRPENCDYE